MAILKNHLLLTCMNMFAMFFMVASGPAEDMQPLPYPEEMIMNPNEMNETAPDTFQVLFDTSKGEFTVDVTRAWAPKGADRFYNLVKNGYYDNCKENIVG